MKLKLRHSIGPIFGLVLFIVALWVLRHSLGKYHYRDIIRHLSDISSLQVWMAVALTAASYLVLTLYDTLGFKEIGHPLAYHRIAIGSFLGYVFSHNMGLSVLGSGAARYRVYSTWGITAAQTAKIVVFCGFTFWLGFFTLQGLTLLHPAWVPPDLPLPAAPLRLVGGGMLAMVAAYLLLCMLRRRPIRVRDWQFSLPRVGVAMMQLGLSCVDWMLAGSVLYVLLPKDSSPPFPQFMGVFLLAECAGLASHVPGGMGVLDAVVLKLMPEAHASEVFSSLLIYRAVYYFLPLLLGVAVLAGHEVLTSIRGGGFARVARAIWPWYRQADQPFGQWAATDDVLEPLVPRVLSVTVFIGGTILLLSSVMPGVGHRMEWLAGYLPLAVIEMSHFTAASCGGCLLILARSLQGRIRAAYYLAIALLAVSALAVLGEGWRYEEAFILLAILASLLPCRREFHQDARVMDQPLNAAWIASIAAVLACSVFLWMFAHKRVEYDWSLWGRFELFAHASRALRASAGVAAVVGIYSLARMSRRKAP